MSLAVYKSNLRQLDPSLRLFWQQVTVVASVGDQNEVKTRSKKRVPRDPNSVAIIQGQLDPLAFDPIVKKLAS